MTDNDRSGTGSTVSCNNDCTRWSPERYRRHRETEDREWWWHHGREAGWHCTTCHIDADHFACKHCHRCMERGRNATYCSTTCRVYAWRQHVTDNDRSPGGSAVTYNTHAERIEAEYRAWRLDYGDSDMLGPVPETEEEWSEKIQWRIESESDDAAQLCANCHRDLEPSEPIWRGFARGVLCRDCTDDRIREYGELTPCDGCGRPTAYDTWGRTQFYESGVGYVYRTYCCTKCRDAVYRRRRRQRAAEQRGTRRCEECDAILDRQRSDARYCSNACRQRAYRARGR